MEAASRAFISEMSLCKRSCWCSTSLIMPLHSGDWARFPHSQWAECFGFFHSARSTDLPWNTRRNVYCSTVVIKTTTTVLMMKCFKLNVGLRVACLVPTASPFSELDVVASRTSMLSACGCIPAVNANEALWLYLPRRPLVYHRGSVARRGSDPQDLLDFCKIADDCG